MTQPQTEVAGPSEPEEANGARARRADRSTFCVSDQRRVYDRRVAVRLAAIGQHTARGPGGTRNAGMRQRRRFRAQPADWRGQLWWRVCCKDAPQRLATTKGTSSDRPLLRTLTLRENSSPRVATLSPADSDCATSSSSTIGRCSEGQQNENRRLRTLNQMYQRVGEGWHYKTQAPSASDPCSGTSRHMQGVSVCSTTAECRAGTGEHHMLRRHMHPCECMAAESAGARCHGAMKRRQCHSTSVLCQMQDAICRMQ